jgi:hypothetical protein
MYRVSQRTNVHAKQKTEWALYVGVAGGNEWALKSWEGKKRPSDEEIGAVLEIAKRAIEFYHAHMQPVELITCFEER